MSVNFSSFRAGGAVGRPSSALVVLIGLLISSICLAAQPSRYPSQDAEGNGVMEWLPRHIDGSTTVEAGELPDFIGKYPTLTIVDTRTETEYRQGHIPASLSIEGKKLDTIWLEVIAPKKDQPIVFYGAGRDHTDASIAVNIALNAGYKNVFYYPDGFYDWTRGHGRVVGRHRTDEAAR